MDRVSHSLIPASLPGAAAAFTRREIASGPGWCVSDVAYTAGEEGRPLCDRHGAMSITAIAAGSFRYRSTRGSALLAPGALLLGNAGSAYECSFEHSPGDRGIHFAYAPDLLEEIAAAVPTVRRTEFRIHRIPPVPAILSLSVRAELQTAVHDAARWEELSLALAGEVLGLLAGAARLGAPRSRRDERRILEVLHAIEVGYAGPQSIAALAGLACMSPYHFMRTFREVVGVTPYQYLLHTRLRHAAIGVGATGEPISALAYDAGFGDLSTFAKAFRRAFNLTPGEFRKQVSAGRPPPVHESAPLLRGQRWR